MPSRCCAREEGLLELIRTGTGKKHEVSALAEPSLA